jgi:hypothetical protein
VVVAVVEMETQPTVKAVVLEVVVQHHLAPPPQQAPVALEHLDKVLQVALVTMCTQFGRKVVVVVVQALLVLMALKVAQVESVVLVFPTQSLVLLFFMLVAEVAQA